MYIVDSNFFIQAHRATYPLDVATGFWDKVKELAESGTIESIDKVKEEIFDKNDELEKWCTDNLPNDFFKDTSTSMTEYAKVSAWAASKATHYQANAINEFLSADEADAFLIAYALGDSSNRIVVTQEVSQPGRKNKVKIPEPCNDLDVRYINTIEMFRELGGTF